MFKVSVACPNCSASLTVPADVLGRKIKCPKCQEVVRLPTATDLKSLDLAESASVPAVVPSKPATSGKQVSTGPAAARPTVPATTVVNPPAANPPGPIMAKPLVPMAKVIAPAAVAPLPEMTSPKDSPPNFSGLDSKIALEDKPRVKLRRKQSNPWPIILLGVGALVVLGLIVTVLILVLPATTGGSGTNIPEIQYVKDSQTEVGKTVRIPIAVTYPSHFTSADKERWTLQVAPENPEGTAWDAAAGFLTWSPGTRDAGKSHVLAMTIQDSVTREVNRGTFQIHVPALTPGIMSALAQLAKNQVEFTATIPKPIEAMKHGESTPNLVEFQIGTDRVDVYDYSSGEIASAKLLEIDDAKLEELGLTVNMTPPLRFEQRDGAIMIAPIAVIEASPSIKTWFDPPPTP
jgi:hypothetical protein